jgi:hypothetical protein
MEFTIHFRGVALFAAKDEKIKEVLFPNAETELPPEGTMERIKDADGNVIAEVMFHADKTPAPRHFAGALIVGPNGAAEYRKLLHRHVVIGAGDGADIKGRLKKDLPPLVDVITVPKYLLKLLPTADRFDPVRVATRFSLNTGDIFSEHQARIDWELDGGKRGGKVPGEKFFAGTRVKIQANETFEIQVTDFTGQTNADERIRLDKDHKDVYFFNFDTGTPTRSGLDKPDHDDVDYRIDHDFKWIYQLMDRQDAAMHEWHKWLDNDPFPAPARAATTGPESRLIPVSTCYETVWPDE